MIRVLGENVLVKVIEKENVSATGIILADSDVARESFVEADVIAVGNGRLSNSGTRVPLDVKVGDVVMINKYVGTEVKYDDEKYIVISEKNIVGIVK